MNFEDLLKDNDMVNKIKDKEELKRIYEEGKVIYTPIQNTLSSISKRIREIEHEEYIKNRGIKYYPILNELLTQIGDSYNELLIDIDEYMSTMRIKTFSSYKLYSLIDARGIKNNWLQETIVKFLVDKNVILPSYDYVCGNCAEVLFHFNHYPTKEELEEKISDYSMCYNCNEEIDLDFDNIQKCEYYNYVNKVDRK